MNNLIYPLRVSKNTPPPPPFLRFSKRQMMELKINEENIENNLVFVSTLEKHLQPNQYQDLFFEIRHTRSKYVYFLFRLNFDFGFFIKP